MGWEWLLTDMEFTYLNQQAMEETIDLVAVVMVFGVPVRETDS